MRVRVERKERAGHASQQRHHHEPMRWERRLLVLSVYLWYGCSFLSHAPPVFMPTDRVTAALSSTYTSSQCSAGYVFFFLPTAPPSPCWRCTTHCCGVAKSTTHGFITDGRLGWRHARCSLACPLRDMRISILPLSHTQRSSAKLAASLSLPITNHCGRGWVREALPCSSCSAPGACWEPPLILLSPA